MDEKRGGQPSVYAPEQLMEHWKKDIRLIFLFGHGRWYKHMIKEYAVGGKKEIKRLARKLEPTEFVLLKWEMYPEPGLEPGTKQELKITNVQDFPNLLPPGVKGQSGRWGYKWKDPGNLARYA